MRVIETALPDVRVLEPTVHRDDRGFFLESFRADRLDAHRDFGAHSSRTTIRGRLRARCAACTGNGVDPQAKLIRVVAGAIFDVVVDIRRRSPDFGRWVGVNLSSDDFRQLYVPIGFAHGFCVLSETADIEYKCSDYYDPAGEAGLRWDDPAVGHRLAGQRPDSVQPGRATPSIRARIAPDLL